MKPARPVMLWAPIVTQKRSEWNVRFERVIVSLASAAQGEQHG